MLNKKMKITKIELDKESKIITVWTDVDQDRGFNFKISEIANKKELIAKVKERCLNLLKEKQEKDNAIEIFRELKNLKGTKL